MAVFIGRLRGFRLGLGGVETLMAREEDFRRPIVEELVRVIEESDPYMAGEIAHSSSGLILADRLWHDDRYAERLVFLRGPIPVGADWTTEGATVIPVAWLVDAAALAARFLLRIAARPNRMQFRADTVLFITDERHPEMVAPYVPDAGMRIINLRIESMTRTARQGVARALACAWKDARGLHLSERVRFARLKFEAAELEELCRALRERGMQSVYFADVTGHRSRLMVRLCVDSGLAVTVVQHGRAANPCKYIPPEGVRFLAYSGEDRRRLSALMSRPTRIRWEVQSRKDRAPRRQGTGVLVCPSMIGSTERFRELRRHVSELRRMKTLVGIRFHPREAWPRIKAMLLGAELVSSRASLGELGDEWGRATVPHPFSSVADNLEDAGFEIISVAHPPPGEPRPQSQASDDA